MSFYQFRGNQLIIVNVYRIGYVQGGNFLPPFLHNSFFGDFSHCYIEMHPQVCKRSLHDARVLCLTWVIDRTSITLLNYYFTYKINNFSLQKSYCNSESCVCSFSRSIVPYRIWSVLAIGRMIWFYNCSVIYILSKTFQ